MAVGRINRTLPRKSGGIPASKHLITISAAASYSYCQPPSGQSRVYRVAQLRTDDVHSRESAGTGPVVLKVVPVTGAAYSGWNQMCVK